MDADDHTTNEHARQKHCSPYDVINHPEQKRCSRGEKCIGVKGGWQPIRCFARSIASKDGLQNECKVCRNTRNGASRRERGIPERQLVYDSVNHPGQKHCCRGSKCIGSPNTDGWQDATTMFFARNKSREDGLQDMCKECGTINGAEWRKNNPNKLSAKDHRRRAQKRGLPNVFTVADEKFAREYWGYRCAVCGRPKGLWHKIAVDHWIPLTDPSPNNPGTVPWNMVPLCHGIGGCNNEKWKRDPVEWLNQKLGKRAKAKLAEIETYFEIVKARHG